MVQQSFHNLTVVTAITAIMFSGLRNFTQLFIGMGVNRYRHFWLNLPFKEKAT